MFFAKRSAESHSRPGKRSAAGEDTTGAIPAFVPDGATLIRPTGASRKLLYPPGKRSAAGEDTSGAIPAFVPDGGFALSGLRHPPVRSYTPARQAQRRRAMTTGTVLCRAAAHALPGIRFVRPAVNLFTIVAETAGADGLKIAETFPEGRGSPHGCGLRAVFCTDAASARPEACRDKSKGPRSGDFAGRSPVQGRRRLAAPVRSLRHAA